MTPARQLPVVDIANAEAAAPAIDRACREFGFFYVVGHGVDPSLLSALDDAARSFFERPDDEKAKIAMTRGGRAWRGWFPVGGELTSGVPDRKEGIYFGSELEPSHPKVRDGVVLHGPNLWPEHPATLRPVVLEYLDAMTDVGRQVAAGLALTMGLDSSWFDDPLILFRIFHYPPDPSPGEWGVGEHTDYGILTLLLQDEAGGLEVRSADGTWIDAPPVAGSFVCNLGDMLERMTGGAYRSTPHRVRNTSGLSRLSFPFFFDPGWDVVIDDLGTTYGDYVTSKVAKVFPDLAGEALGRLS